MVVGLRPPLFGMSIKQQSCNSFNKKHFFFLFIFIEAVSFCLSSNIFIVEIARKTVKSFCDFNVYSISLALLLRSMRSRLESSFCPTFIPLCEKRWFCGIEILK